MYEFYGKLLEEEKREKKTKQNKKKKRELCLFSHFFEHVTEKQK